MKIEIRHYELEDWGNVQEFLRLYWRKDHPLLDRDLFEWQYKGFGPLAESFTIKLLFYENELIGFLGSIPGIYQVIKGDEIQRMPGISPALWVIRPDFRNRGGGLLLLREAEKLGDCLVTLAVTPEAVRFYKIRGFSVLDALNRYVIPLDMDGYKQVISRRPNSKDLQKWMNQINIDSMPSIKPFDPNPEDLESFWLRSIENVKIFTTHRDADFWDWRYINSTGFKYYFLGDVSNGGVIVVRLEHIISPENSSIHGEKILRIIEMIPEKPEAWNGEVDNDLMYLVKSVLKWGKTEGCIAADFQCSTKRLEKYVINAGFKKQTSDYGPPLCSLAGLFQPLKFKPMPINALWRVSDPDNNIVEIPVNDTYFVKSNCDMDRPNIWPLPKGWR